MADNVAVTEGSGKTIATDDVGGVQYQVVKLGLGAANAIDTHLDSGQQTMANSVPVAIASNQGAFGGLATSARQDPGLSADIRASVGKLSAGIGAISANVDGQAISARQDPGLSADIRVAGGKLSAGIGATSAGVNLVKSGVGKISADTAAIKTAIQIIDDWDESDRAKVNPIAGQAGVAGNSGVVSTTTQRVVLAKNVGLPSGNNILGSIYITGAVSTTPPEGGALSSRQDPGLSADIRASVGKLSAGIGATSAKTELVRVGVGASSARLTAIQTAVQIIDDWDESDRAKVNPIVGQAGIAGNSGNVSNTTQRVVLAKDVGLPSGSSILGSVYITGAVSTTPPEGGALSARQDPGLSADIRASVGKLSAGIGAISAKVNGVATSARQDPGLSADIRVGDGKISARINAGLGVISAKVNGVATSALQTSIKNATEKQVRTSGGLTPWKSLDLDQTQEQVKGSAGQLYVIHAINMTTSARYVKIFDKPSASVTMGTTVPRWTLPVPANADADGAGFAFSWPGGLDLTSGITLAATTGPADNTSGAPGTGDVIVNVGYK